MYPDYDEKGNVICKVCGKSFGCVSPHVKSAHPEIGIALYKERFPNSPTVSKGWKTGQKYANTVKQNGQSIHELRVQEKEEEILRDQHRADFKESIEAQILKETESEVYVIKKKAKEHPFKDKQELYNYLKQTYKNLQEDYTIEKTDLQNFLEYSYITDMADPSLMVDFEFTKSGWHNRDIMVAEGLRDKRLIEDGWMIIRIDSKNPTIDDIKKALEKK